MLLTDHPDERDLLNGVLAAPLDDAPRLVLSDWYDENGQEDRAWYIRYRLDGARSVGMLPNIFHSDDERNCDIALRKYGTSNVWFHRGFMHSLHIDYNSWEEHADAILAEHPIEVVRLMTSPEVTSFSHVKVERLMTSPGVTSVSHSVPHHRIRLTRLDVDYDTFHLKQCYEAWESQWNESRPWLRFEWPQTDTMRQLTEARRSQERQSQQYRDAMMETLSNE